MAAAANVSLLMLVVEDHPADVVLLREAMEATHTAASLRIVSDGHAALAFLHRRPPFGDAPRPDVVVLDLNLPITNGREVLTEMMADPDLRTIPVVVLTTSTSESSVCALCPPGRCLYFAKTASFKRFQEIVELIAAHARTPTESHDHATARRNRPNHDPTTRS